MPPTTSSPTAPVSESPAHAIILPVIWETEEAAYPISHIAPGRTANGTPLILASLGDGRAQAFDLDGVKVAQSARGAFAQLANGGALIINDTSFAAHPSLTPDGAAQITLTAPQLNVIAPAPILDAPGSHIICSRPDIEAFADADTAMGVPLALANGETLSVGLMSRQADALTYKEHASLKLSSAVTACALSDYEASGAVISGYAATDSQLFHISGNAATEILRPGAPISHLSVLTEQNTVYFIWSDIKGGLYAARENGDQTKALPVMLQPGMSVSAPNPVTALSTTSMPLGVDYPSGLIVITGYYDDARPRIAMLSARALTDALSEDAISGALPETGPNQLAAEQN